jgi:hypothetical protein
MAISGGQTEDSIAVPGATRRLTLTVTDLFAALVEAMVSFPV